MIFSCGSLAIRAFVLRAAVHLWRQSSPMYSFSHQQLPSVDDDTHETSTLAANAQRPQLPTSPFQENGLVSSTTTTYATFSSICLLRSRFSTSKLCQPFYFRQPLIFRCNICNILTPKYMTLNDPDALFGVKFYFRAGLVCGKC